MQTDDGKTGSRQTESPQVWLGAPVPPITLDVIQDYPAAWDWRLVVGFVIAGVAALYLF